MQEVICAVVRWLVHDLLINIATSHSNKTPVGQCVISRRTLLVQIVNDLAVEMSLYVRTCPLAAIPGKRPLISKAILVEPELLVVGNSVVFIEVELSEIALLVSVSGGINDNTSSDRRSIQVIDV